MNIGIIAAENKEMMAIKNIMNEILETKIYNLTFFSGKINNKNCVLVECGVGKVNAARVTQILIDKFDVTEIINVGSAGGVKNDLNIGDIVIGKALVQYDFDITDIGDYEKGEICEIGKYIYSDEKLVDLAKTAIQEIKGINIKIGNIGSADRFAANPEKSLKIGEEFDVECLEMEGAAIAQVCYLDKIPFLVIRGISDIANGNNKVDFHEYLEIASKQAALVVNEMFKLI